MVVVAFAQGPADNEDGGERERHARKQRLHAFNLEGWAARTEHSGLRDPSVAFFWALPLPFSRLGAAVGVPMTAPAKKYAQVLTGAIF